MSVDFFDCTTCGRSVCQCGPYAHCWVCGHNFCKGCHPGSDSEDLEKAEVMANCPVCSLSIVLDSDLLAFALAKLGTSRKRLEKEYKKAKRDGS